MQAATGAPGEGVEELAGGGAPVVDVAAVGEGDWGLEGSHVDSLPYLTALEGIGGILKARNGDFVVEEVLLPGVPDGKEGFIVVAVEREGATTADVQKQLAALFCVKDVSKVAYAGLKDKDAVSHTLNPTTKSLYPEVSSLNREPSPLHVEPGGGPALLPPARPRLRLQGQGAFPSFQACFSQMGCAPDAGCLASDRGEGHRPRCPRRQKSGVPQERGCLFPGDGGVCTSVSFL